MTRESRFYLRLWLVIAGFVAALVLAGPAAGLVFLVAMALLALA